MRRSRALAVGLALVCVALAACGRSSAEVKEPRPPAGDGATRGPDVSVESVDELRAVEVSIIDGRFRPGQVSVGFDSTVRIFNRGQETVFIEPEQGLAAPIGDNELEPGEKLGIDFLESGIERLRLRGSDARLEIFVAPPL